MKKFFKLSFAALAISLSVAACNSDKKAMGSSDSTTTMDSSSTMGVGSTTTTDSSATMRDTTTRDTTPKM